MMCEPCFYNGNRYEFVQSLRLDLENAQRMCQKNGGSLAKHLDERVAKNLNKCCQNGGQYRIGLIADEVCNGATPFRWIGEYSCRDSSPWKNINPWFKCQTISISLLYYIEGRLPNASLQECETNTNYICQYSLQITTSAATSATIKYPPLNITIPSVTATTSPTPKFTPITTASTAPTISISKKSTSTSTSIQNFYGTERTSNANSLHAIGIAGISLGLLVMIMLIVVTVWCCKKKRVHRRNMNNIVASTSTQHTNANHMHHHVYDK